MWYVEFIRARRALGVYALFLLFMVLVAVALRIYAAFHAHTDHIDNQPIEGVAYIAAAIATVFATVLATSLAYHVAGHLELSWTKPVGRERLIFETMLVDIAAIAIAYGAAIVVGIGILTTIFGRMPIEVTALGFGRTAIELLFIIAFYMVLQAATSGQRRMAATIAGVAWPVLMFLLAAPSIGFPAPIKRVFELVNYLNPLALLTVRTNDGITTNMLRMQIWGIPALLDASVLIALGLAIAILRWRRLEA